MNVQLIWLNTEEPLTYWMSCQWFWRVEDWRDSQAGCVCSQSCQWFWSTQTLESNSQPGCMFNHSVSGSDLVEHGKATYHLDTCSTILISRYDLVKYCQWRVTHFLDACSVILVSGYDLFKHLRVTHNLDPCSAILISSSELLKLERNSHTGSMFSHSHQIC